MDKTTFSRIGKVEALRLLYEGTPFGPQTKFFPKAKSACVSSQKVLTEGVDFDLVYFPLKHLGYKAVVMATGELYAAMAHPRALTVRLGVSSKLDFPQVQEIWQGIVGAAREHCFSAVELDLQPSVNGLFISVGAIGEIPAQTQAKAGKARSKDLICISGALGAAYLGQQVLERQKSEFDAGKLDRSELEKYRMLVGAYLKPELDSSAVGALEQAGIYPPHGYFVSRGLSDALLRLRQDSGLGVKVYADKMPFEGGSFEFGAKIDADPVSAAMNGGDDCRLLYVVPIDAFEKFRHDFQAYDIIGHLAQPECGAVLVAPGGAELPVKAQGWKNEDTDN